jgi:hypothetical protein
MARPVIVTIAAFAVVCALMGVVFAFVVPAGLPYDEPAHWATVEFFASHGRLPVLGEAGSTYEAQQTPLYYVLAAGLAAVFHGGSQGFLAVRLFGAAGLVLLAVLVALILVRVLPNRPLVAIVGTAFIALNPMLLVMSASVQNDTWSLVWGLAAVAVALRRETGSPWLRGLVVGLLGAASILTKVSAAPIVIALVVAYLIRRRVATAFTVALVVVAAIGWWIVRNIILYGDLTGQAGVDRLGLNFAGQGTGVSPSYLGRTVLTYLTLPTEYLRNTIESPTWTDALSIFVGAVLILGLVVALTRLRPELRRWPFLVVWLAAAISVLAWLAEVVFGWSVAFRTAYGCLPLVGLCYGSATQVVRVPWVRVASAGVLVICQVAMLAWVVVIIVTMHHAPMLTP